MNQSHKNNTVSVNILGQEYLIRSREEEKVRRVARYLNEQIEQVQKESRVHNRIDLLVMAAFKAGGDYFDALEELESLRSEADGEAAAICARLDELIAGPAGPGRH